MNAEAFFLREARVAGEAAFRILHPPEPFTAGASFVVAFELYRMAIHWALAAHALVQSKQANPEPSANKAADTTVPSLQTLLESTKATALAALADDKAQLDNCVRLLRAVDYISFAHLDEGQQQALCSDLERFYRALVAPLVPTRRAEERAIVKRNAKLLALGGLALAVTFAGWRGFRWYKQSGDLALNAAWSSSSTLDPNLECRSPHQDCKEGQGFFFHTKQENKPWLTLDLGKNRKFTSVEVVNRQDCCRERANALTVSVSKDNKTWEVVAEHTGEFKTFTADFHEVSARYVKLEIPKPSSMLHLARVRVFP